MARTTTMPPRTRRQALHHPLRFPTIVLLIVAGAAHIPVTPEHLKEAPYIGYLFLALTIVCFALALILLRYDTPAVWAVVVAVSLAAVLAYVVSRMVALPEIADDVGNWTEPLGLLSITSEFAAAALGLVVLQSTRRTRD